MLRSSENTILALPTPKIILNNILGDKDNPPRSPSRITLKRCKNSLYSYVNQANNKSHIISSTSRYIVKSQCISNEIASKI